MEKEKNNISANLVNNSVLIKNEEFENSEQIARQLIGDNDITQLSLDKRA